MELTTFEAWLGRIDTLTEPQRRRAWQALALSETAKSPDIEMRWISEQAAAHFEQAPGEPQPTNPAAGGEAD